MAAPQTSSRLQLLQARFQQKQLQEKEQKLLQLYDQQQQRAHQVAQRGSAGSNGSNGSNTSNGSSHGNVIGHPAGKVRQMFDERRQNNGKGIDKSYPLEPLDSRSKKHTTAGATRKPVDAVTKPVGLGANSRRNAVGGLVKRTSKPDVNSNVSSGSRTVVLSQRDSFSRESYASSRSTLYKDSVSQRETISRDSYVSSRENYNDLGTAESIRQVNGHETNGRHYEINIDEVIDNEAMERNRMLAKFHPIDIEKRRRFSGDIESEEFSAEMLHDVPDKVAEKPSATPATCTRKSSQTETKAERFKNTNTKKSNATATTATKKRSEPAIPTGANARQSTVMKTTKSASLKVRKLARNKKTLEKKTKLSSIHKSNQVKEKAKETVVEKSKHFDREENHPAKWNSLKSTSLVCEVIRTHNRIEQSIDTADIGKVKTIVTKLENTTKEVITDTNIESKSSHKAESIVVNKNIKSTPSVPTSRKRLSIFDSDLCKMNKKGATKVSCNENQHTALKNIENEDKGDGLIHREEANSPLTVRGNRKSSMEHPTDCQEITIADQTMKVKNEKKEDDESQNDYKKLSGSCASNRVRRASFELKCMMFEQMQGADKFTRRDSVESALRHFDSIDIDVTDSSEPISIATNCPVTKRKKSELEESAASITLNQPSEENKREVNAQNVIPHSNENSNTTNFTEESDYSTIRLCTKDSVKKDIEVPDDEREGVKGFEKHTSAWSMKTLKVKPPQHMKAGLKAKDAVITPVRSKRISSRKKVPPKVKKHVNKKLLEARDSIELARVSVKTRVPTCKRKLNFNSNTSSPADKVQITVAAQVQVKSDDAAPVKSQSFSNNSRVAQLKSVFLVKQIPKTEKLPPSTRNPDASKKADSRASESIQRKNVTPYPSSKSPDASEQKSRPAAKTSSLKLLNRAGDSNDETQSANENGTWTATRKSSLSAIDYSESGTNLRNQSFDCEKPMTPVAPAPRTTSSLSSSSSIGTNRSQGSTTGRTAIKTKSSTGAPSPAQRSSTLSKGSANNDDSLTTCKICNRRFTTERITLHEQICAKTSQKKRKQFDAVTHRVRGTELESFVHKPTKKQSKAAAKPVEPEVPKSNWRRKHEDFINAIRSAKQMQAHLAAGGKLSDLPPPPPSDTSDYVQCPHCSRKFNQGAAERHIPKCETMQHNKTRVQPRSKR